MKNFTISNNLKNQIIDNIVDFLEKVSKVEDGELCVPYPEDAFYEEDCPIYTSFFTKDKGKKTKWTFHYGATKMVFVPNHYNFVIKIPFNCGGEFLCGGDDIAGCYVNRILFPYERAIDKDDKDDWNYCKVEEKLYKKAIENKVDKFFAGTYFFKNIKVNEEIYPILRKLLYLLLIFFTGCGKLFISEKASYRLRPVTIYFKIILQHL